MRVDDLKRKVYVDMDDVICDSDKATADINGVSVDAVKRAGWDSGYWSSALESGVRRFFANMEWTGHGKQLLKWFDDKDIPYTILSRPCGPPYTDECIRGKKIWLQNAGLGNVPALFEFDKSQYADNGNILIDDLDKNIDSWNAAGGVGILYRDSNYDEVINRLTKILHK